MRTKKIKRSICLLLALLLQGSFCLTSPAATTVTLDVKEHPVYRGCTIDEVVEDTLESTMVFREKYNGQDLVLNGTVSNISVNGVTVFLKGSGTKTVEVSGIANNLASQIGKLKKNDLVKVYGKGSLPLMGGNSLLMVADEIRPVKTADVKSGIYETREGKKFADALSQQRSLGGGAMKFRIPAAWKAVETSLTGIEGYQYKVNEIASDYRTEPEQVFVYYFSNEKYLSDLTQKDKTTGIELAIVKNILRREKPALFPTKSISASYGPVFDYYVTGFLSADGKDHNVEFVFTPAGNDGICCILYVFSESRHKEDILYLMRTLEIR